MTKATFKKQNTNEVVGAVTTKDGRMATKSFCPICEKHVDVGLVAHMQENHPVTN
jgi:hypothetical protein